MSKRQNHREDNIDLSGGDPRVRINETPSSKRTKESCARHNKVHPRKMSVNEDTHPDNLQISLGSYEVVDAVRDGQSKGNKENNDGGCECTVKDNKNQTDKVEEACSGNKEDDKKGRERSETCTSEVPKNVFVKNLALTYEFEKHGITNQNVTVKDKKRGDSIDRKSQTMKHGVGNYNRSKLSSKEDDDESPNSKEYQKGNLINNLEEKLEDRASSNDNNELNNGRKSKEALRSKYKDPVNLNSKLVNYSPLSTDSGISSLTEDVDEVTALYAACERFAQELKSNIHSNMSVCVFNRNGATGFNVNVFSNNSSSSIYHPLSDIPLNSDDDIPLKENILSDKHLKYKCIHKMKDQIENLTQENDVLKDRLKQRSQNENLTLKQQIEDLKLQNSNMKAVITQSEEKGEEYTKLMESLVEDLKNKHLSVLGHLWNKFSGKKSQPDDMIDKLAYISNYVKKLDTTVVEQKHLIEIKEAELKKIRQTLSRVRTEKENSEKKFNRKSAEQAQLLKETDDELKKIKESKKYYEEQFSKASTLQNNYQKQLKECKDRLEQTQHELNQITVTNDTLERNLNIQISANMKLQEENHNFQIHIPHLENCLRDEQNNSKECRKNMNHTKTLLNQEYQSRAELNNTLKTQQHNLQMQEENYLDHFNTLSDTLAIYYKMVSPEEVSEQAEKCFIEQAVRRISKVEDELKQYEDQIEQFEGNRESKTYLHIKEMLLRAIEALDAVESEKKEKILALRKQTIGNVRKLLKELENKVKLKY